MTAIRTEVNQGEVNATTSGRPQFQQRPTQNDLAPKFEAMIVRQLVGFLMPEHEPGLAGGGAAGKFWKTLFLDGIADKISGSGKMPLMPSKR